MNRVSLVRFALGLALVGLGFSSPMAFGQTTFTLSFDGATVLSGNADESVGGQYTANLATAGGGPGAQGWSVSISADGASIDAITTAGSSMLAFFSGGFNKTQTTSAGIGDCAGRNGAVSAIVLSLTEGNVLPESGSESIAVLDVSAVVPAGGGTATLRFINGCQGSGQPVSNNITQDGNTVPPDLQDLAITLREIVSCCNAQVNIGFAAGAVSSDQPYDGIVDDGSGLCSGLGGSIVSEAAPGAVGAASVFAAVSSKGAGEGVQGWSFSIALDGAAEFASVTTAGTPGIDNNFSGGFNKTQIVDPADPANAGQRGAVSAIVLSLTENKVLPVTGTEAVLKIDLNAAGPQDESPQVATLTYKDGLKGSGQPVNNALTVDGNTVNPCDVGASVDVVFQVLSAQVFLRGNANDDVKVDIADPIYLLNELFRGGPPSVCADAADANNDGMVDSADAVYLIAYEFQGGSPPAAPFPDCGTDPEGDDDGVTCDSSHSVCR